MDALTRVIHVKGVSRYITDIHISLMVSTTPSIKNKIQYAIYSNEIQIRIRNRLITVLLRCGNCSARVLFDFCALFPVSVGYDYGDVKLMIQ